MAVDRLVQRLIAAGATPERAKAFAERASAKPNVVLPEKKGDPGDGVYDDRIAALSRQLFPTTFIPPVAGTPEFDDYYDYLVRQGRVKGIAPLDPAVLTQNAYVRFAPKWSNAIKSSIQFEKNVAEDIANGYTPNEIIANLTPVDYAGLKPRSAKDLDPLKNAVATINEIYSDYAGAAVQVDKFVTDEITKNLNARQNELNKNRDYRYGLPDRTLKYGPETNLKEGIVSFRTVPGVQDFYEKQREAFAQNAPGASQAGGIAVDFVQKQFEQQAQKAGVMPTPYLDEGQRRFNIKLGRIR